MATSPFELFRRNLKPLMIALTVLAMFAFVVLPALQSYQQMSQPGGSVETKVATYEGGSFDINEIDYFNRNHNLTLRFLSALAEKTMERGGTPQVPGFVQDPQTGAIQALGINSNPSPQAAVTAKLFAAKAEEMGMELDDAALRSWLDRFVDGKLSSSEINALLATSSENQLGQFHMYEQLRTHLLASAAQQVVSAGLGRGNRLTTPPAEQFELFRRLNQQAVVTAYPVLVEDYLEQVTGEPTEAEIKELYEEGKKRYPDETSSEPAFRRPATRAFEFVTADTEKFIEEEMKTISEEELRAEYERRLEGGEFRMPQSPDGFTPPGGNPAADQAPEENAADQNADDASEADEPADEQPADSAGDEEEMQLDDPTPSEDPAEDATPSEQPTEDATPSEEAAPSTGAEEEPNGEGEPAEESAEEDDPAEPDENASLRRSSNPLRLVAFAPQDEAADSPQDDAVEPVETPEQAETPPADAPEPSESAESETPAPDASEPAAPAEQTAPEADQAPAPSENAEAPQEEDDAAASPDEASPPEEETGPPSFEEIRDDIARQLASAPAIEQARAATRKVTDAMRRYFTRKAIYETGSDKTAEPPVRPDLEAMAEELGLEYGKTEPLNPFELQNHPLGKTATRGVDMQSGERLPNLVFGGNVPLESPIETESMATREPYVSWIIAKTEESIPELSEVRDEVIAHWRQQRARELAERAAQELATKANESDQPLSELVPEDRKSLVSEDIGPFPWMLWLGRGRPIEWNVQELDRTGEKFMQQVFFQPIGQFGVAPNAPKTVYYTVKTSERTPETNELRERFLRGGERLPVSALAGETISEIQQGYFESFQEEIGLEWSDESVRQ